MRDISMKPVWYARAAIFRHPWWFCFNRRLLLGRHILLALLSSLAKVEAEKNSDRTKAGMARAKAKGVRVGRPRLKIEIRQQIAKRAAKGETPHAIAKALRIDRHTAAKYAV